MRMNIVISYTRLRYDSSVIIIYNIWNLQRIISRFYNMDWAGKQIKNTFLHFVNNNNNNNMYALRYACRTVIAITHYNTARSQVYHHFFTEPHTKYAHILGTMNLNLFQTNLDDEHTVGVNIIIIIISDISPLKWSLIGILRADVRYNGLDVSMNINV